ncbi:MAG: phosphatidylglycerol lysyltransferase domain-containing protein [Gemmatimonas sp.]
MPSPAPFDALGADRLELTVGRVEQPAFRNALGGRDGGFKGLRAFKDKFDPRWEPRYIASSGSWTLPIVLAEVAMLTNGPRAAVAHAGDAS